MFPGVSSHFCPSMTRSWRGYVSRKRKPRRCGACVSVAGELLYSSYWREKSQPSACSHMILRFFPTCIVLGRAVPAFAAHCKENYTTHLIRQITLHEKVLLWNFNLFALSTATFLFRHLQESEPSQMHQVSVKQDYDLRACRHHQGNLESNLALSDVLSPTTNIIGECVCSSHEDPHI